MGIDRRVRARYELTDEDARLWKPGVGTLVRLRTWDIFERVLPSGSRVVDVGGGPGAHAARLAQLGHEVRLFDPVAHHVERAAARAQAQPEAPFEVAVGAADRIDLPDGWADAVLLMGPLYHLIERADRIAALREGRRVLRSGGVLLAEVITRHAWLLDATLKGLLADAATWQTIEHSVEQGLSQPSADEVPDGAFWAYFHRIEELRGELAEAGLSAEVSLIGVEGYAWLLGDLEERLADPEPLLRALRLCESEPSMLGVSAHVIAVARSAS